MPAKMTIKIRPDIESVRGPPIEHVNDLETSSRRLYAQVESHREREKILAIIGKEQRSSGQAYVTYDRLREILK